MSYIQVSLCTFQKQTLTTLCCQHVKDNLLFLMQLYLFGAELAQQRLQVLGIGLEHHWDRLFGQWYWYWVLIGSIVCLIWGSHVCVLCWYIGDGLRIGQGGFLVVFILLVLLVQRVLRAAWRWKKKKKRRLGDNKYYWTKYEPGAFID